MTRRIDAAAAWAAYQGGHAALREWLAGVPSAAWSAPSVLAGWSVADLAAHLATVADSVTAISAAPRGGRAGSVSDYLGSYGPIADVIADRAQQIAATADQRPEKILAVVDERFDAAQQTVQRLGLRDQVVNTRRIPVQLGDYFLTRVVEVAVHADDFARSLPDVDPPTLPRDTQRTATRALLDVLAERAPGRSVEVRVPPHAAVQCVEGPRHTRGTPSNVVEMTPLTWLRLAAGRTSWSAELGAGTISASGERADLAARLPLL